MQIVAKHLELEANRRQGEELDLFARSAFNRYYYACYRLVWQLHKTVYPEMNVPGHRDLPDKIERSLYRKFLSQFQRAAKRRLISEGKAKQLRSSVRRSTSELSNVLRQSYGVRCTADYHPEILVIREGSKLVLELTSLAVAPGWVKRVNQLCSSLISEWKSLGN